MKVVDRVLKVAAKAAFGREEVKPEKAEWRMGICNGCPNLTPRSIKCTLCGCYMEVKTTLKINFNPKKLRYEITHCPAGKWRDRAIANQYRALDGLEPLT